MELTSKQLQKYFGCSEKTAKQRKDEIIAFFELPPDRMRISDTHLAKYERLTLSEVHNAIK